MNSVFRRPLFDFGITTHTNSDNKGYSFSVFPNPASKDFVVVCSSEIKQLEIFNAMGVKVHSEKLFCKSKTINIGKLPSGIYLVKANDGKKIFTRKIVKVNE